MVGVEQRANHPQAVAVAPAASENKPSQGASTPSAPSPVQAANSATMHLRYQGLLTKQPVHGHLLSRPRLRFFSMTDDAIEWFKDERAFRAGSDRLGHFPLTQARIEWKEDSLVLVAGTGDRLVLQGSKLSEWESSLQAAITRLAGGEAAPEHSAEELKEHSHITISSVLSGLDDRLVTILRAGDMRLVRTAWVLQPSVTRIQRRQVLEELEAQLQQVEASADQLPLLSLDEAVALVLSGDRSMGALTYGWLSPGDPDPAGRRLEVVRQALRQNTHIVGFFWDYASLFQVRCPFRLSCLWPSPHRQSICAHRHSCGALRSLRSLLAGSARASRRMPSNGHWVPWPTSMLPPSARPSCSSRRSRHARKSLKVHSACSA